MLAARDQENLVHGHQTIAASKPLNQGTRAAPPKTPGNRYPKTPLKVPLQDENATAVFGAKSVLGTKGKGAENLAIGGKIGSTFDKTAFVTPIGPRNRAPLGMKTTNAKTKAFQTPAVDKASDNKQTMQASTRRPKPKSSHPEMVKLEICGDEVGPLEEREIEYAPPKPKSLPYDSDDFPDGHLNYDMLKGPNLMRGWQKHYFNPVDENGVNLKEKQFEAECVQAMKENDEKIMKAVQETDWSVGDVPETFAMFRKKREEHFRPESNEPLKKSSLAERKLATIASRKAASALSVVPRPVLSTKMSNSTAPTKPSTSFLGRAKKPVIPVPSELSSMRHTAAAVASRSTIGYTKGRNASNQLTKRTGTLSRSISNLSTDSDITITPARYAQRQDDNSEEWRRLKFLGAFDIDDEDLEPCLKGALPECLRGVDDEDEEFVMALNL